MKNQVQNRKKHSMSDLDAFQWENSINAQLPLLPTFKMIDFPRSHACVEKITPNTLKKSIDFPVLTYTGEELVQLATKIVMTNKFVLSSQVLT